MKVSKYLISLFMVLFAVKSYASELSSLNDAELAAKNATQRTLLMHLSKYESQISSQEKSKLKEIYRNEITPIHVRRKLDIEHGKAYEQLEYKAFKILHSKDKKSEWSSLESWEDFQEKLDDLEVEIANILNEEN